jgi:hypothetical protein
VLDSILTHEIEVGGANPIHLPEDGKAIHLLMLEICAVYEGRTIFFLRPPPLAHLLPPSRLGPDCAGEAEGGGAWGGRRWRRGPDGLEEGLLIHLLEVM